MSREIFIFPYNYKIIKYVIASTTPPVVYSPKGVGHMKRLPLGVQNFKEIVTKNHVYIDKTQYIYELINSGKCYFLSRPRRFGKSLLLDTIAEVFLGNKELFKGLWIYESDYGFDSHPVVRLDMSNYDTESPKT